EILKVGPQGLGLLRAAPAAGAVAMGIFLAHRPPFKRAGRTMLIAVAVFALAIIGFGLSRDFYLSLALLALSGMADNVSVVIRSTLIQLLTPPQMLGRVSSVNSIFVGSSNELASSAPPRRRARRVVRPSGGRTHHPAGPSPPQFAPNSLILLRILHF